MNDFRNENELKILELLKFKDEMLKKINDKTFSIFFANSDVFENNYFYVYSKFSKILSVVTIIIFSIFFISFIIKELFLINLGIDFNLIFILVIIFFVLDLYFLRLISHDKKEKIDYVIGFLFIKNKENNEIEGVCLHNKVFRYIINKNTIKNIRKDRKYIYLSPTPELLNQFKENNIEIISSKNEILIPNVFGSDGKSDITLFDEIKNILKIS